MIKVLSKNNVALFLKYFGVALVLYGSFAMIIRACCDSLDGPKIAIDFFILMLGISLAFPAMIQDPNGGLSTMRVVAFMMINVICLLMLKTGWTVTSIENLKIDKGLMGVIAFIFGTKATQSYFERKFSNATSNDTSKPAASGVTPSATNITPSSAPQPGPLNSKKITSP